MDDAQEDQQVPVFEPVPPSVQVAASFIATCMHHCRPVVMDETDSEEWGEDCSVNVLGIKQRLERPEMHPKQEAAFERACNLIGTYFDREAKMFLED